MISDGARHQLSQAMEERADELNLNWREVAANAGISVEAVRTARYGPGGIARKTRRGIERGLQWPPGHVDRILEGKSAEPDPTPAPEEPSVSREDIESGNLSLTQVVHVLSSLATLGDEGLFWDTYRSLYARVHKRDLSESQGQIN